MIKKVRFAKGLNRSINYHASTWFQYGRSRIHFMKNNGYGGFYYKKRGLK